jgi:hypothetical protein
MEPLEGIARADERLGRRVPLPSVVLGLGRWIEVYADGPAAVEVVWNLDDTRPGSPGRLALRVSTDGEAPTQLADAVAEAVDVAGIAAERRGAPLAEAQESLRPVVELRWAADGLWFRLTAQGPWTGGTVIEVAASIVRDAAGLG